MNQDSQIAAWLKEKSDFEKAAVKKLLKDVTKSEYSDHNIHTEQSAVENDQAVPKTSRVVVKYIGFNSHSRGHLHVTADMIVSQNAIVDSKSFYTSNLDIYGGKQLEEEYLLALITV